MDRYRNHDPVGGADKRANMRNVLILVLMDRWHMDGLVESKFMWRERRAVGTAVGGVIQIPFYY